MTVPCSQEPPTRDHLDECMGQLREALLGVDKVG